jgi:hypothetical protein
MNLPTHIQPVEEGSTRGVVSPEIWKPIVGLAKSLKTLRGQNCEVYLSEGRFVVDLANSTRGPNSGGMTDGGPGNGPGGDNGGQEEFPWPDFPPTLPEAAGWTTGHMIAGFYAAKYKCGIRGFTFWRDGTIPDNGERFLRWNIQMGAAQLYPAPEPVPNGKPLFEISEGPWFYDGGLGTNVPSLTFPTLQNSLVNVVSGVTYNYGEVPQDGSCVYEGNRYTATTSGITAKVLSYRDEISMAGAPHQVSNQNLPATLSNPFIVNLADSVSVTSFTHDAASGSLSKRYKTSELYEDIAAVMNTAAFSKDFLLVADFAQPTGAVNTTDSPSTTPFTEYPTVNYYNTVPLAHGSHTNENQGVVATNSIGSKTLNKQSGGTQVLAYHFARKAKGGGTYAAPTGKIILVEMQRCQFGSKPGPTTWYIHKFTVPEGYGVVNYPQQRLPSNGTYVETTSVVSAGTHTDLVMDQEVGYYIVNRVATPPAPETPAVDTGQALQPAVSLVGADHLYQWNHGEPYLTFEIYRNTTNNSATATLIATISGQEPTANGFDAFSFSHTDTGPFVGGTTYFYWHKAYYDASRKSGFSIVKSRTY